MAAALAAGETPSPEVVAAAEEVGTLSPVLGLACLAVILLGLATSAWMSTRTTLLGLMPIDNGSDVLAEQARTIVRSLGYPDRPADEAYAYMSDEDYLRYIRQHDRSATQWNVPKTSPPSALPFWYRQSPRPLIPGTFESGGAVTLVDPPETVSGMVSIQVDPAGRPPRLSVVPSQLDEAAVTAGAGRVNPD